MLANERGSIAPGLELGLFSGYQGGGAPVDVQKIAPTVGHTNCGYPTQNFLQNPLSLSYYFSLFSGNWNNLLLFIGLDL